MCSTCNAMHLAANQQKILVGNMVLICLTNMVYGHFHILNKYSTFLLYVYKV